MKKITIAALCVLLGTVAALDSRGITSAAADSVRVCLEVIIPSLFAMMALASFATMSGIHRVVFKPPYWLFKPFLRLDEDEFAVFAMSLIGGYPVGVKLLSDKVGFSPNYAKRAETMLMYCYCGSPAFIAAVCPPGTGAAAWLSNVIACVIIAVAANITRTRVDAAGTRVCISGQVLVDSVSSCGAALYKVCLMIVLFGVLLEAADYVGAMKLFGEHAPIIRAFFEISNCVNVKLPVEAVAALSSFGGVCVLFQAGILSGGKIKLAKFLAARVPAAILSAGVCRVITPVMNTAVSAGGTAVRAFGAGNAAASVCLLIMTGILIFDAKKPLC